MTLRNFALAAAFVAAAAGPAMAQDIVASDPKTVLDALNQLGYQASMTTAANGSTSSTEVFTFLIPPAITSVSPIKGPVATPVRYFGVGCDVPLRIDRLTPSWRRISPKKNSLPRQTKTSPSTS